MNNQEFIKYTANRYGLDENTIETMVDIFSSSLQELLQSGTSVAIDEIGEFKTSPLFPKNFNHTKLALIDSLNNKRTISFKASPKLGDTENNTDLLLQNYR